MPWLYQIAPTGREQSRCLAVENLSLRRVAAHDDCRGTHLAQTLEDGFKGETPNTANTVNQYQVETNILPYEQVIG